MLTKLKLPHGTLQLPIFLPDGTQGVVRTLDARDLETAQIQAVQMNVFHLMQRPGSSTIQALGGLHRMAGWRRPIFNRFRRLSTLFTFAPKREKRLD